MKKKILSIILAVVMIVGMIPLSAIPAFAEETTGGTEKYIVRGWDDTEKKVTETEEDIPTGAIPITSETTTLAEGGWYVVSSDVTVLGAITVNGTEDSPTNLILMDGCKLTASSGIALPQGKFLNIYGQSGNTGTIEVTGDSNTAGIGGGYKGTGGTLTVHGGTVKATGGNMSAGIGGGRYGGNGGNVTVYGGTVNATGNGGGAGIGGGNEGDGGIVKIYGGIVTAVGKHKIEPKIEAEGIGHGADVSESGSLELGDSAVIEAGNDENDAEEVPEYKGEEYVRIHWHNFIDGDCICGKSTNYIVRGWNGEKVTKTKKPIPEDVIKLESSETEITLSAGAWYVVFGEVDVPTITVEGTPDNPTSLILTDGCTLNVDDGIVVETENALNIYGQKGDSGTLNANGGGSNAGIGSIGRVSGDVKHACGTVVIHGGTVNATGGVTAGGAGIGGGGGYDNDGGTVIIYGGTVNAYGDRGAAGIGGGPFGNGGDVYIYGGAVTADIYKEYGGAGIGAGAGGKTNGTLTLGVSPIIKEGKNADEAEKVSEYSGKYYVQIHYHTSEMLKSTGDTEHRCSFCGETEEHNFIDGYCICGEREPTITVPAKDATCTDYGWQQYYTWNGKLYEDELCTKEITNFTEWSGYIKAHHTVVTDAAVAPTCEDSGLTEGSHCSFCGEVLKAQETISATGHTWIYNNSTQHICSVCKKVEDHSFTGDVCDICCGSKSTNYILRSWDDNTEKLIESEENIPTEAIKLTGGYENITLESGWYVVYGKVSVSGKITVKGTQAEPTNLILTDGCTLTVEQGILLAEGYALSIYGQKLGTGMVSAQGDNFGAGIGGGNGGNGGSVYIYGGAVTANGGNGGAGIGGGRLGDGGNVYIYGGTVTATGGNFGAGIGGGNSGNGGAVTVYGGIVTANGGNYGAGIGGGGDTHNDGGNGGTVTVNGGTVTATGGNYGAGIGGGNAVNGSNVYIYDGAVTANGGDDGAGIGGGRGGDGGDVQIYDGMVSATGNFGGAGIGGGAQGGNGGNVEIYGGTVTANGGNIAVGIGAGSGGNGGSLYYDKPAVIKAGFDENHAKKVETYSGESYVRMHCHNSKSFVSISNTHHKCKWCDYTEYHTDADGDFICDLCGYEYIDLMIASAKAAIDEAVGDNPSVEIKNVADTAKSAIETADSIKNIAIIRDECLATIASIEALYAARHQAVVAIDEAAGTNPSEAIKTVADAAKSEIETADSIENVAIIRDECLTAIASIKAEELAAAKQAAKAAIDEAAGDEPIRKVKAVIDIAKEDIDSATSVEEVIGIRNECFADIKSLTGDVHIHTFADTYSHNDTHHWKECTCGHKTVDEFEEHTFGDGVVDGNKTTYTCTECGYTKVVYDKPDDEGEVIGGTTYTGISLTLGSDISINFYMELSGEARQNGTMTFDIGGRIVTLKGTDAKYNSTEKKYYFQTPLTVLEMAETVTATFCYNGVYYVQEYSVAEYIDTIVGNPDIYGDEAVALAKRIANYGYYAQIYLASIHSNVTIGKDGYEEMDQFDDVDIDVEKAIEALANYKVTVSGTSDNISLYGSTVYFDSATAFNYYVTVKDGVKPTATAVNKVTGEEKQVEIKLYKNNIYIVSVKDITATELADDIEVVINGEITLTGSVFAYCNSVVKAHSFDGATEKDTFAVNAMAAFYEYYKAACDYAEAAKPVYYDVTFNMGTHGEDITVKVKKGDKVENPENPVNENFVFDGWYADQSFVTPWDFDTAITENTTIYAKWREKIYYTVTFDMMEHGEQVSSQTVAEGGLAEYIAPEAEGYFFDGWFKDETLQDRWRFNTDTVNGDITLYAKWRKQITVTFDMMGHGSSLNPIDICEGATIPDPLYNYNDLNFKFEGWYKDLNFTEKWNFDTEIVGDTDIILYAKWVAK